MPLPKYIVRLTGEERTELEDLNRTGKRAASVLIHARILLKADAGTSGPGWEDDRIAEALECGDSTVYRARQAFVERGLEAALSREKPTGRQYRKLDGAQEARPITLACGAPPEGRSRWTMRLLADRLVSWRWWTPSARNARARRSKKRGLNVDSGQLRPACADRGRGLRWTGSKLLPPKVSPDDDQSSKPVGW